MHTHGGRYTKRARDMGQSIKYQVFLMAACAVAAFGGQSIQLSTATASNSSVPAQRSGNAWRVEFSIHDWDSNYSTSHPFAFPVGANVTFYNFGGGNLAIYLFSSTASNAFNFPCEIPMGSANGGTIYANRFVTVRFQEDPVSMTDYCQAWDALGNLVVNTSYSFSSFTGTNSSGATVSGTGQNLSTAYFRVYTSTVATNARPPVTADTTGTCLVFWKFDGNLNDSCSAGPYSASIAGGSEVYVSTPFQNLVVPILQTANPPVWGNTASLRAGFPSQLNGSLSYSQADGSATVQCFWQSVSGPSTLIWSNRNSCTPTILGTVFGDYKISLVATDVNNNQAAAAQDIGAVATDSRGVVVNPNPAVNFLFGPIIAWGQNPWGYADYWSMHATTLRSADYAQTVTSQNLTYPGWSTNGKPQWEFPGQGTVSYHWNCAGQPYFCGSTGLALGAALGLSDTSVTVNNASSIDTSELPTRILVSDGTNTDELRVCSVASNTLTLCYDPAALPRHSFANGAGVLQAKVAGSGTKFLTDATSPVCPVGAPGPPGPASYSAGTAALTAGSATVTGTGTSWMSSGSAAVSDYVRVSATHSSMPFVFVAQISAIGSDTSITLARPFPADADTASGLSYAILPASRTIVLHYPNFVDQTGDDLALFGTTGCESEDAVYLNPVYPGPPNSFASGWDTPLDGQLLTGKQYSITDTTGWVNESSTGGINFYGEDLAHWANYFASGLTIAKTTAQTISNYWIHSPWGNGALTAYPVLFTGGGGLGAWVSYLTDPDTKVSISDLRTYATIGVRMATNFASMGCNAYDDTRDSGWAFAGLILAAIYDPDTTSTNAPGGIPWRTYWQNNLATMQTDDNACENQTPSANNSWANGFIWNANTAASTLTNGSTAVAGTGFTSSMCAGIGTGTGSATNGSATVTITAGSLTNSSGDHSLVITGTRGGTAYTGSFVYTYSGSGTATLSVMWPGDTGNITWMSTTANVNNTTNSLMVFATSHNDLTDLSNNYACMFDSPTSLTLDHAWQGATGSGYFGYWGNLAGFGQQPFMLGIKALGMHYLATQTVPAISNYAAPYTTFTKNAAAWINSTGYDPNSGGMFYGRVFSFCEPPITLSSPAFAGATRSGCDIGSVVSARELNAEVSTAASLYYEYNTTLTNRAWADGVYGSMWGFCPWTTGGVYCDANSPAANPNASNLLDSYIHGGKWTGFFAGAGMSHRWPAARLGGLEAAIPRTIFLPLNIGAIAGAASAQVVVTAPSGAQTVYSCSTSPCSVSVDDREGTHLYQIQYLASNGHVVSQSDPDMLH